MQFLHAAISKSGAGQLDLLILETNRLHGAVSLCMLVTWIKISFLNLLYNTLTFWYRLHVLWTGRCSQLPFNSHSGYYSGPFDIFWKIIVTWWINLKLSHLRKISLEQNGSEPQTRHHFRPCLWRYLRESNDFSLKYHANDLMLTNVCRVLMLSKGFALKKLCWLEWTTSLNTTEKTRCWRNGLTGAPSFWNICIAL